ncbi:MAG: GNAT family N-acetyltransferase [Oscillospiraceae bacterium]|nr:GNAT family N-acetyltransferase [Oscillospiraceae bacterium]
MEYRRLTGKDLDGLWEMQLAYKAEIGEAEPSGPDRERLREAVDRDAIRFCGAWDGARLVGVCSVTLAFSTFLYAPSGIFEDFYIRPAYRHKGIARELVRFARQECGACTLTVGCADCDVPMYEALGFSIPLGRLLAFG